MKKVNKLLTFLEEQKLEEGINQTIIPSLRIFKSSNVTQLLHTVYEPSLFVIVQGRKIVSISRKNIEYDSSKYLCSSSFLPVSGKITKASKEEPFLSLQIVFSFEQIFAALESFIIKPQEKSDTSLALCSYTLRENLLDVVTRLTFLLKEEKDIAALEGLYLKEILYRLLISDNNMVLRQLAYIEGNAYKISTSISFINNNLCEYLAIEELAKSINMSVSSFHKHFKALISVSPLQYIKIQRLHKAKKLMLSSNMDITGACYHVGYQSASQFSREYSKYFGITPSLDIKNIKKNWFKA